MVTLLHLFCISSDLSTIAVIMYKLDVAVDGREAAAIERRRNLEKQRQSRIFNPRERTIGVKKNKNKQTA